MPTFRAAGAWSFTATNVATPTTLTPGAPAGVAVGDLLLLVCESRSITATVATPTGWTLATGFPKRSGTASGGTIYVFTRIADGSANDTPSPVWSGLTTGNSGDASGAGLLAWSGAQAVQDGTVTVSDLAAQTTTTTIPTLTTATDHSLVVGIAMKLNESAGQTSTVSGRTERADNSTASGTGHIIEVCDVEQTPAGTTAACTVTWSATTSARALAVSIGLLGPTVKTVNLNDSGLAYSDGSSTGGTGTAFGSTTVQQFAGSIKAPTGGITLYALTVMLKKTGAPADNVELEIRTDSSGLPSSTVLATSNLIAATQIPSTPTLVQFNFNGGVALTGGTTYWVVFRRSGATDNANNYTAVQTDGNFSAVSSYADGFFANGTANYNGTTWASQSGYPFMATYYDVLAKLNNRTITDTGMTTTQSVVVQKIFGRTAADTGMNAVADTIRAATVRLLSVTGLTVSDSLAKNVPPVFITDQGLGPWPLVGYPLGG
jgi:hypothetical protein